MSDHYRRDQIQDAATKHDAEAWGPLRLQVSGSKHLNITKVEAFAIAALLDRNDNPPAADDVVATPLNGIQSGEHYYRCERVANWLVGRGAPADEMTVTRVSGLFAYLAGSTDERPW